MTKIAVIDLDSIIFSAAHPNKVYDINHIPIKVDGKFVYEEKSEEQMLKTADKIMNSILTKTKSTGYIAYVKGVGNFRYAINPEYKANRNKQSPIWWNCIRDYLITKWGAIQPNNIEVDDAVSITVRKVDNSFICALDNDLLGLEGTHYNWRLDKWITVSMEEAEQKFWSDMITGQPGDNIKGIPGRGKKYAERLIKYCDESDLCYHTQVLDEYIQHFGEPLGIDEFYKNYKSLKILETYEDFEIPSLIEFKLL